MAGRGAPSFLKRQKEQKRAARAVTGDPVEDEFELLTAPGLEGDAREDTADGSPDRETDADEDTAH